MNNYTKLLRTCYYKIYQRNYSNNKRVVITGMGVVSPVGCNVQTAWKTIINGGCGIKKLDDDEYMSIPSRVAAVVDRTQLKSDIFSKRDTKIMSVATQFALIAADEAVVDANLDFNQIAHHTGVSVGSGMVDLIDIVNTYQEFEKGYKNLTPFFVPRILINMPAGQISIKYGLRGPNHTVSTACATGAHAIGDGFRFIKQGNATVMICGATDACVSPFTLASFCRMKALATKFNDTPEQSSRPFDELRDGFVMGEGAAIVVLEEMEHALNRNANIYAEIKGYGLSGDGSHITAPRDDCSGAITAMQMALDEAKLSTNDVTYINAHATSTPLGDALEAKAIQTLFGLHSKNMYISSTKGAHGHLLGGAGSLESVFTIKAINDGILPPTLNFNNDTNKFNLNFVPQPNTKYETDQRVCLKNSFGFGGTNATLCYTHFEK